MKNQPIRIMLILAAISLSGIIVTQAYWVSKAVDEKEEDFNHRVRMSLRSVADNLCTQNGNELIESNPIDQVSSNYFVVRTQYNIQAPALEHFISSAFKSRAITQNYEYGIFSCESDRMVHGKYVSIKDGLTRKATSKFPKLGDDAYYFGVYFPDKKFALLSDLDLWKYMTGGSILMTVFFAYGLTVVLKQKRLSEVQEEFVDNVSHELRTPISTLKLASKALEKNAEGNNLRYLKIIDEETARLEKQVGQILSTSTQKNHKYDFDEINASELFDQLVTKIRAEYASLDKEWQIRIPSNLPTIYTNEELLSTALRNLIENALKYGKNKVCIKVEVEKDLIVYISDDGPGIPRKHRRRVFQKFYRIPTENIHDVKGYGLGMYIVKENLKRVKALVRIIDSPEGACFKINIPV